jgi:hypothetical protein
MRAFRVTILALLAAVAGLILLQLQTTRSLRHELAAVAEENARLRQALATAQAEVARASTRPGLNTDSTDTSEKRVQQLESEVIRLRGIAGRAVRAEAELAQIKSQGGPGQASAQAIQTEGSDGKSSSEPLVLYLGDAVAPPPNLDPAYGREGLLNAIQQAAANAGVSLKKVEIET